MAPHFRDEMYRDVKMLGYNVRGLIIQGLNIGGHYVPFYKEKKQVLLLNSAESFLKQLQMGITIMDK
jgi:hypothetical protein